MKIEQQSFMAGYIAGVELRKSFNVLEASPRPDPPDPIEPDPIILTYSYDTNNGYLSFDEEYWSSGVTSYDYLYNEEDGTLEISQRGD